MKHATKSFLPFLLVLFFTSNAHAYLDPGTGSMILQAILGGIAGAAVLLKLYWGKIRAIFSKSNNKPQNPNPA